MKCRKRILANHLQAFVCTFLMLISLSTPILPMATALNASQQTVLEPTLKSAYSEKLYESLCKEMNAIIQEKGFSELAKQFLQEILLNKLKNYNQWRTGYLDMPSAKEYLRENLIDALKNVKSITLIDEDSQRAKEMIAKGWAAGETDGDFNIVVMYRDPAKLSVEDHLEDLEKLDHEIKHCKDKKVIFKIKHYKNIYDLRDILIEGGATFHQKFVGPLAAAQSGSWAIGNRSGTKQIAFEKNNCYGYLLHLYLYETLVYLAGYRTVEDVSMGHPVMSVKEEIARKYGSKTSNKIWNGMFDLHRFFEDEYEDVDIFRFAVNLHKQIMKCIQTDIERLNEKKPAQVRRYMEVYRYYKLKVMPKIYKDQFTDITSSVFNTDALDSLLVEKIIASHALPRLMEDMSLNSFALLAMLYVTSAPIPGNTYCYLPPTISDTYFIILPKGKGGKMVMRYSDEDERKTQIVFLLGKEGIKKIYSK